MANLFVQNWRIAFALVLLYVGTGATLEPVGCYPLSYSTGNVTLPLNNLATAVRACASFCGRRPDPGFLGLVNGESCSAVECHCFPPTLLAEATPSSNASCAATCCDDRSPVSCGVELELVAAAYSINATLPATECHRLCWTNTTSPCASDPTSSACINLIASCYVGDTLAVASTCFDPAKHQGTWDASFAYLFELNKDRNTFEIFMHSDSTHVNHFQVLTPGRPSSSNDPWLLQELPADAIPGSEPYGYIYPPASQLADRDDFLMTSDIAWYPRMCSGGETECHVGLQCGPGCATPTCSDMPLPSLKIRNEQASDGVINCHVHHGIITLVDYPYDPATDPEPCRTYRVHVEGGDEWDSPCKDVWPKYQVDEVLHPERPGCANVQPLWSFNVNPVVSGSTAIGVRRQDNVFERFGCDPNTYDHWKYDRDVIATFLPSMVGGPACSNQANPSVIRTNAHMNEYSNCHGYQYDVQLLWVSPTSYAGYLANTTHFNATLEVGDSAGENPVVVAASAFRDLAFIDSIVVHTGSSADLSGCGDVIVANDFELKRGSHGNYAAITTIFGDMVLYGNVSNVQLPSTMFAARLLLTDVVCLPGQMAVETTHHLLIAGSDDFDCDIANVVVTDTITIDLQPPAELKAPITVSIVANLTLSRAALISSDHFPQLQEVTDTLWIKDVEAFDWPADSEPLVVHNLVIGSLDPDAESTCASLGNLRIHVTGDLTVINTDLVDLRFLHDVTSLRSLTILNNRALNSLDGLEGLNFVLGSVHIEDNSQVLNIDALSYLLHVGGDVNIRFGNRYLDSVVQPCPCDRYGLLCAFPLDDFVHRLAGAAILMLEGDERNRSSLMAQSLLCGKALPIAEPEHLNMTIELLTEIANRSHVRQEFSWTALAIDAMIYLKTELQGPTTTLFVPLAAPEVLIQRSQMAAQILRTAQAEHDALQSNVRRLEALHDFKERQLDRSAGVATFLAQNLDRQINERDEVIQQMVQASAAISEAALGMMESLEDILEVLEDDAELLTPGMQSIKDTIEELTELAEIMQQLKKETANTTGTLPPPFEFEGELELMGTMNMMWMTESDGTDETTGEGADGRTDLMGHVSNFLRGARSTTVGADGSDDGVSRAARDLVSSKKLQAAIWLAEMVDDIFKRVVYYYGDWLDLNEALGAFHTVLEHLHTFIAYVTEIETAITTAATNGNLEDLDDLLQAGNFTMRADWQILLPTLEMALRNTGVCFNPETNYGPPVACENVRSGMQIVAIWGTQLNDLASTASEHERAIATTMTALNQLERYEKSVQYLLDDLEQMTEDAVLQALSFSDQFLATVASVGLYELQQLCSSIQYYAPDVNRNIPGCDPDSLYVAMSARQLQRHVSSAIHTYKIERRARQAHRTSFVPPINVTDAILDRLPEFLSGGTITLAITPELAGGVLATDQNAEWLRIFVELKGLPSTLHVPGAPYVDIEAHLQSPFVKIELGEDNQVLQRHFAMAGYKVRFAFWTKPTAETACTGAVDVPAGQADNICAVGLSDGQFTDTDYQLPAALCTVALRIANMQQILDYDPAFFANVYEVRIGGTVVTNPQRPPSSSVGEVVV